MYLSFCALWGNDAMCLRTPGSSCACSSSHIFCSCVWICVNRLCNVEAACCSKPKTVCFSICSVMRSSVVQTTIFHLSESCWSFTHACIKNICTWRKMRQLFFKPLLLKPSFFSLSLQFLFTSASLRLSHFSPAATLRCTPWLLSSQKLQLKSQRGCTLLLILHQWMTDVKKKKNIFFATSVTYPASKYMICYIINIKAALGGGAAGRRGLPRTHTLLKARPHRKHRKQAAANTPVDVGGYRRYTHTHTEPQRAFRCTMKSRQLWGDFSP